MRDIRKQQKAERNFYQRDELQQCRICGRLFVRRKDTVCSMACKAKAEEGQASKKIASGGD
jgi:hypothetical protein